MIHDENIEKIKKEINLYYSKYDVVGLWVLNYYCNFRCEFCFNAHDQRENRSLRGFGNVKKIAKGFDNTKKKWLIQMSGGEPFLFPDFIELCKLLTKKHSICLNTNLASSLVYKFIDQIDPHKVEFLYVALHIDERKRLNLVNDLIKKIHYARDKGFHVYVTQVMTSKVIENFEEIFNEFYKNDIVVYPKCVVLDKFTYNEKEKIKFKTFSEKAKLLDNNYPYKGVLNEIQLIEEIMVDGELSYKGLECLAGIKLVVIDHKGNIMRCSCDVTKLGNVFEGEINLLSETRKCYADRCKCPYYSFFLTTK